jgi:hypothetical protein
MSERAPYKALAKSMKSINELTQQMHQTSPKTLADGFFKPISVAEYKKNHAPKMEEFTRNINEYNKRRDIQRSKLRKIIIPHNMTSLPDFDLFPNLTEIKVDKNNHKYILHDNKVVEIKALQIAKEIERRAKETERRNEKTYQDLLKSKKKIEAKIEINEITIKKFRCLSNHFSSMIGYKDTTVLAQECSSEAAMLQSKLWKSQGLCCYCGCNLGLFKKCKSKICGKKQS